MDMIWVWPCYTMADQSICQSQNMLDHLITCPVSQFSVTDVVFKQSGPHRISKKNQSNVRGWWHETGTNSRYKLPEDDLHICNRDFKFRGRDGCTTPPEVIFNQEGMYHMCSPLPDRVVVALRTSNLRFWRHAEKWVLHLLFMKERG